MKRPVGFEVPKPPPEAPPEPGQESAPMPDDAAVEHVPVEAGPVP